MFPKYLSGKWITGRIQNQVPGDLSTLLGHIPRDCSAPQNLKCWDHEYIVPQILVFPYWQLLVENIFSCPHLRGLNIRFDVDFPPGSSHHLEIWDETLFWWHFGHQWGWGEGSEEGEGRTLGISGITRSSWNVIWILFSHQIHQDSAWLVKKKDGQRTRLDFNA